MFISFGLLNKKGLLFLVVPVAIILRIIIGYFSTTNYVFYHGFLRFLGRSFNGFIWLAIKKSIVSKNEQDNKDTKLVDPEQNVLPQDNTKILNDDEINGKSSIYIEYETASYKKRKMKKKRNLRNLSLLIFVCVLDSVSNIADIIITKIKSYRDCSCGLISLILAVRLFAIALFSYLIIKNTKIYRHHYLSIIILIIVVIAINIFSSFTEKTNNVDYFEKFELMILPELLFSIMYVCGAKYLSISEGNLYKLLFVDGVIGIIIFILLQILVYFFISCDLVKILFIIIQIIVIMIIKVS